MRKLFFPITLCLMIIAFAAPGFSASSATISVSEFKSGDMVMKAYKARIVQPQEAPELYATVDRLRQNAGLPMPTVAIAPHQQPNAFATGRNPEHAVVCVTQGLLQIE